MNDPVQTSVLFNMWQWNVYNLIDCVNIWKSSEAAKFLLQEIPVMNRVKHSFFLWILLTKCCMPKHCFTCVGKSKIMHVKSWDNFWQLKVL